MPLQVMNDNQAQFYFPALTDKTSAFADCAGGFVFLESCHKNSFQDTQTP